MNSDFGTAAFAHESTDAAASGHDTLAADPSDGSGKDTTLWFEAQPPMRRGSSLLSTSLNTQQQNTPFLSLPLPHGQAAVTPTPSISIQLDPVSQQPSLAESALSASVLNLSTTFLGSLQYPTALVRLSHWTLAYMNPSLVKLLGHPPSSAADDLDSISLPQLFPRIKQRFWTHTLKRFTDTIGGLEAHSLGNPRSQSIPVSWMKSPTLSHRQRHVSSSDAVVHLGEDDAKTVTKKAKLKLANDELLWVELNISEVPDASANDRYVLATIRPLTDTELSMNQSRYANEFEELGVLGKGGYGTVYRAQNKIDGQEYAIKKVRLRHLDKDLNQASSVSSFMSTSPQTSTSLLAKSLDDRLVREVQTFARISNHPNVVRYYAAWIELAGQPALSEDSEEDEEESEMDERVDEFSSGTNFHLGNLDELQKTRLSTGDDDDDDILFADETSQSSGQVEYEDGARLARSFSPPPMNISSKPADGKRDRSQRSSISLSKPTRAMALASKGTSKQSTRRKKNRLYAILYIQMQLCPYNDLRRWLDSRGGRIDQMENLSLFRQIVEGVGYIHRKGFVHRDIKPENIFTQDGHIYLSDFGLTKSIADRVVKPKKQTGEMTRDLLEHADHQSDDWMPEMSDIDEHVRQKQSRRRPSGLEGSSTKVVGTFLYAAPESRVTTKSDIFSLGILLLELFLYFTTAMERALVLTDARKSILPKPLIRDFPIEADLISRMLALEPDDRPSAAEILQELDLRLFGESHSALGQSPRPSSSMHSRGNSYSSSTYFGADDSTGPSIMRPSPVSSSGPQTPLLTLTTPSGSLLNRRPRRWSSSDAVSPRSQPADHSFPASPRPDLHIVTRPELSSVATPVTPMALPIPESRVDVVDEEKQHLRDKIETLEAQLADLKRQLEERDKTIENMCKPEPMSPTSYTVSPVSPVHSSVSQIKSGQRIGRFSQSITPVTAANPTIETTTSVIHSQSRSSGGSLGSTFSHKALVAALMMDQQQLSQ